MSIMKTVVVSGVVGGVILLECGMAYFMIPSSADIAAHAGEKPAEGEEEHAKEDAHAEKPAADAHGGHAKKPAADAHGGGHAKKDAGGHGGGHVKKEAAGGHGGEHGGGHGAPAKKSHNGVGTIEVDLGKFNLMVHKPSADVMLKVSFHLIGTVPAKHEEEFLELLERNQHRLRDRIIFEIRNSDVVDLTDPGLGLIKRRILTKSNELLGQPLMEGVVFSEFSYNQL